MKEREGGREEEKEGEEKGGRREWERERGTGGREGDLLHICPKRGSS